MADVRKAQTSSSSDTAKKWPAAVGRQASTSDKSLEAKLLGAALPKSPSQDDRLAKLTKHENEILRDVHGTMEHLKSIVPRVKTEGVRDDVDKLSLLLELLVKSRSEIKAEYRTMVVGERSMADSAAAGSRTIDQVAESEARILGALGAINGRLDAHEKIILRLEADNGDPQGAQVEPASTVAKWTEVVKKQRRATHKSTPVPGPAPIKPPAIPLRPRPLAVIVKKGEEQFPELLRTVRSKVDPIVMGTAITKMRQTQNGNLLIEVSGGADSAATVKREIERSLGPGAEVRTTEDLSPVEVRDLDEVTTKEEVLDAVLALGDAHGAKVVSIRRAYGGAQTAVILLPRQAARKICEVGRIQVGLMYARVRRTELSNRCFRCLAFGHAARNCTGPDRRSCCWRCGADGHVSAKCMATEQAAAKFKQTLSGLDGRSVQSAQRRGSVQSDRTEHNVESRQVSSP